MNTTAFHQDTDLALLRATARFGILPQCVADKLIGKSSAHAARKLSEPSPSVPVPLLRRHVKKYGVGPSRQSYFQLTPAGCRHFGVSEKRAEPFGTAALMLHVAIGFFSVLGEHLRYRLFRDELVPFLEAATPRANVPHILTTEVGHPAILRIYHAVSPPSVCLKHLVSLATDLRANSSLGPWVLERDYGIAVLAPSEKSLAAINKAINRVGLRDDVLIVSGIGPIPETLNEELKRIP